MPFIPAQLFSSLLVLCTVSIYLCSILSKQLPTWSDSTAACQHQRLEGILISKPQSFELQMMASKALSGVTE